MINVSQFGFVISFRNIDHMFVVTFMHMHTYICVFTFVCSYSSILHFMSRKAFECKNFEVSITSFWMIMICDFDSHLDLKHTSHLFVVDYSHKVAIHMNNPKCVEVGRCMGLSTTYILCVCPIGKHIVNPYHLWFLVKNQCLPHYFLKMSLHRVWTYPSTISVCHLIETLKFY